MRRTGVKQNDLKYLQMNVFVILLEAVAGGELAPRHERMLYEQGTLSQLNFKLPLNESLYQWR